MKHDSQARLFKTLQRSLATLTILVLATAIYGVFVERPYLSFPRQPFAVIHGAHAGELVELSMERCNSAAFVRSYLTTNRLTNLDSGQVHLLPDNWLLVDPGCTTVETTVHQLPDDITPGTYTLSGVAIVAGLFREHRIEWASAPFEVTPRH